MSIATRSAAPLVGDVAPDVTLREAVGMSVRLAELWTSAPLPLVLVFVRHFV